MPSFEGRSGDSAKFRPYVQADNFNTGYPIRYRPADGIIDMETGRNISMSLPTTAKFSSGIPKEFSSAGIHAGVQMTNSVGRKNVYSDLEFREYFVWSNTKDLLQSLCRSSLKNYARQFMSQPFEVSRLLLQVGAFSPSETNSATPSTTFDEDEDDEEDDFFERTGSPRAKRYSSIQRSVPKLRVPVVENTNINPLSLNTIDVMSALISKEGFRGLFRCTNTSFLYTTLFFTIDAWICGFVSPIFGVPDPFFIDIVHSTNPFRSLLLSVASSCITGLLLAPVSLIRTRFIATTTKSQNRSFKRLLGQLTWKQLLVPLRLIVPTINFELSAHLLKTWVPYFLYTRCSVDRYTSPLVFSTVELLTSVVELFVKLPLETLLRRSQVDYLVNDPSCPEALRISENELSVKFGGYHGYFATLYYIYNGTKPVSHNDKFSLEVPSSDTNVGLEGLFRGWRVGLLNVISSWGLSILHDQSLENVEVEKF
ncbi:unnamed protein product [Kuraishia capsulata CBS 1993]|uniref:Mitochondrial fusion and transport protein UGO1 n=1 Tax=Kuraishia capsulata CBS 1993 TaxID=1382522 RepID=W6MRA1_9ASCO|nr:uncharacterized protein KUCA_T00005227001 [Kuraishia capsulata CBS 1993]CDK29239.1 unnamed protein product [Kuraishia capsulata CBS 1993]